MSETTPLPPAVTTGQAIGSVAGAVIGAMFPQEKILLIALQALIREAPGLYVDAVELFGKKDATPAEREAFTAKLVAYMDPEVFYEEARKRAGQ
jgi:hypothetical protein